MIMYHLIESLRYVLLSHSHDRYRPARIVVCRRVYRSVLAKAVVIGDRFRAANATTTQQKMTMKKKKTTTSTSTKLKKSKKTKEIREGSDASKTRPSKKKRLRASTRTSHFFLQNYISTTPAVVTEISSRIVPYFYIHFMIHFMILRCQVLYRWHRWHQLDHLRVPSPHRRRVRV